MRRLCLLSALFLSAVIWVASTTIHTWLIKRDLGYICSTFKQHGGLNLEGTDSVSKSINEIDTKIRETLFMPSVKDLWHNSFIFDPPNRYVGFKGSVDKLLEESWDCKPMEEFFSAETPAQGPVSTY